MAAHVPSSKPQETTIPQWTTDSSAENKDLRESLSAFVHGAPDDEKFLYDAQRTIAEQLKQEVLKLFTPEKLVELHEICRQADTTARLSFPNFLIDPLEEIKSMQLICAAGISLECWENRGAENGVLKFLKDIHQCADILWQPAPPLPTTEIEALHVSIILHFLLKEESTPKLLQHVKEQLSQSDLQDHIENEERTIAMLRREITPLNSMTSELVQLETEEIDKRVKEGLIDERSATFILDIQLKILSIQKIEETLELLKALNSFLKNGETQTPLKVLRGSEKHLNHLVDRVKKKKKPEGNPDNEMVNLMRMEALSGGISDDAECTVQ